MKQLAIVTAIAAGILAGQVDLAGQTVISARAGLVHYVEGEVYLGDAPLNPKFGEFPEIGEGKQLRTALGRAEVLLAPGIVMRMAEESSIKLISNRLMDTRIELLSGSVLVEAAEVQKGQLLTVVYKDSTLEFPKRGMFRVDTADGLFRVYEGEAVVVAAGQTSTIKEGRSVMLAGVPAPEKFDTKVGDAFYRWAGRRSESLAAANLSAARSIGTSYTNWDNSGWRFNPYFGCYTFVPARGIYTSAFGSMFYGPRDVGRIYEAPRVIMMPEMSRPSYDMGGYRGGGGGGGSISSGSAPSGPAPSAPAPGGGRSADGGGSRGSGGRGR